MITLGLSLEIDLNSISIQFAGLQVHIALCGDYKMFWEMMLPQPSTKMLIELLFDLSMVKTFDNTPNHSTQPFPLFSTPLSLESANFSLILPLCQSSSRWTNFFYFYYFIRTPPPSLYATDHYWDEENHRFADHMGIVNGTNRRRFSFYDSLSSSLIFFFISLYYDPIDPMFEEFLSSCLIHLCSTLVSFFCTCSLLI